MIRGRDARSLYAGNEWAGSEILGILLVDHVVDGQDAAGTLGRLDRKVVGIVQDIRLETSSGNFARDNAQSVSQCSEALEPAHPPSANERTRQLIQILVEVKRRNNLRCDAGHPLHFQRNVADVARDSTEPLMAKDLRVEHHPQIVATRLICRLANYP